MITWMNIWYKPRTVILTEVRTAYKVNKMKKEFFWDGAVTMIIITLLINKRAREKRKLSLHIRITNQLKLRLLSSNDWFISDARLIVIDFSFIPYCLYFSFFCCFILLYVVVEYISIYIYIYICISTPVHPIVVGISCFVIELLFFFSFCFRFYFLFCSSFFFGYICASWKVMFSVSRKR